MSTESTLVSNMNQQELQEVIKQTVTTTLDSVLTARSHIDSKTHQSHHDFVARQKERYEACRASRTRIINGIITAIGIMLVSAIGVWTWDKFKSDLQTPTPIKVDRK